MTETEFGAPPTETEFGAPPTETEFGAPPTETEFGAPPTETEFGAPHTVAAAHATVKPHPAAAAHTTVKPHPAAAAHTTVKPHPAAAAHTTVKPHTAAAGKHAKTGFLAMPTENSEPVPSIKVNDKELSPEKYVEYFTESPSRVYEIAARVKEIKVKYMTHMAPAISHASKAASTDEEAETEESNVGAGAHSGIESTMHLFMAVEEHSVLLIALLHWVGQAEKLEATVKALAVELAIEGLQFKRTALSDEAVQPLLEYARKHFGVIAF